MQMMRAAPRRRRSAGQRAAVLPQPDDRDRRGHRHPPQAPAAPTPTPRGVRALCARARTCACAAPASADARPLPVSRSFLNPTIGTDEVIVISLENPLRRRRRPAPTTCTSRERRLQAREAARGCRRACERATQALAEVASTRRPRVGVTPEERARQAR